MKSIKIYIGVMTLMLLCAIGLGVYVWYTVQKLNTSIATESSGLETSLPDISSVETEIPTE